jgi:hypothetical protein
MVRTHEKKAEKEKKSLFFLHIRDFLTTFAAQNDEARGRTGSSLRS